MAAVFLFSSALFGLAAEPVTAPENPVGTIDFPVLAAPFGNATRVRKGMQDLKSVAQDVEMHSLRVTAVTSREPDPATGGERQTCSALAVFVFEPAVGPQRVLEVPVTMVTRSGAGSPGAAVQGFDTEMVQLQGEIFGDPDFDLLRVTGGSDFGLPSPGHTTLTRLGPPGSDFAVDSFFDIAYRIEFQGAPGGALDGQSGVRDSSGRCEQPLKVLQGVPYEALDGASTVLTPEGLRCEGGVIRLASESASLNYEEIKWTYSTGAAGTGPGLELPDEGDTLRWRVHVRELDKSSTKLCESVCSTSGGVTSCTMDFSALGATGTRVEVWNGGVLSGSGIAPAGTEAFHMAAADFRLHGGGMTGQSRRRGDVILEDISCVKELDKSSPKLCSTPGGDFLGDEIRLSPVGAQLRVGPLSHVDLLCDRIRVIDDDSVRIYDCRCRGLGDAALSNDPGGSGGGGRLVVSNIGSSGEDGVSVDLGEDGRPPVRVGFEDLPAAATGGGGSGGALYLHARDELSNSLGSMRVTGSGDGTGGRVVFADFSTIGSPTALVRVYDGDTLAGEAQVALKGDSQVAELGDGPDGASGLRACGKNQSLPPFQFPCFAAEFDRATVVTPTGSPTPLVGDRMEVLADGGRQSIARLRYFDVTSSHPSPLVISDISHAPDVFPPWIWDPSGPTIPPSVSVLCSRPARFDTGASSGLPPGGEGLEFRVRLHDLVEVGPSPVGGTEFSCVAEIAASGLGSKKGYDYYQAVSASCVIQVGSGVVPSPPVEQIPVEMLSMDLSLPPGDPDFAQLSIRCGSALGLPPCPGQLVRTRLPSGNFHVDSFFDITYQISFTGAQGGPLSGAAGGPTNFSSTWPMYVPDHVRWGLVHSPLGSCDLSLSPSGGLTVSNIGSSGLDGVSVACVGAQGCSLVFQPHQMLPGASMRLEAVGDAAGLPASSSFGHVTLARSPGPDSFFDIFYDLSFGGGGESCVQVLSGGVVVSETVVSGATGQLRLDPGQPGADPPSVRACGKLPGLGGPSCYFVTFGQSGRFSPPDGGDPVVGDELRVLALGIKPIRLELARCVFTDDNDWDLLRSSLVMHGRDLQCDDGARVDCWDGSCRVCALTCPSSTPVRCADGSCAISPAACPAAPPADALTVRVSPRDAASGLPTGKRQHKPLSVSTSGLLLGSPGQSLHLSVTGTAGGASNQTIGELEVLHAGGELLTSVQWPYQLSASTRVMVRSNPLYESSGNTGENPLYEGVAPPGTPPVRIDASTPVLFEVCGAAPGDNNPLDQPAYLCVSFASPVSVTAPDGIPYLAREVIFIPEDSALPPVSDLQRLTLSGVSNADYKLCYSVDRVFTGPDWHTGLSCLSQGSCTLETDASGHLVVSNIGSSGLDGVSIDMRRGQGARVECEPCPVTLPNASLSCGVRGVGDLNRDGLPDLVVSSRNDNSSCWVHIPCAEPQQRVVCRDSFGNAVGDFILPPEDLGVCSPGRGGGAVFVSACGWNPPVVSSLGVCDAGPYLEFSEPVTFTPSKGAPVECSSLQVCCPDQYCVQYRESDYSFVCRLSNLPDQPLVTCSVCHLVAAPHSGLGEAQLRADAGPDTLTVSNIGSSGLDGVSIDLGRSSSFSTGGSGGEDRLTENVSLNFAPVPLQFFHSGGGGAGKIAVHATGSFDPNGGPPVSLGVCALDVDSDGDSLPVEADFSSLGTQSSRVVVLNNGQLVGQFVQGDPSPPVIVGRIRQAGATPPSLTGCGKLRSEQVPGGWQPPCFVWNFSEPVVVVPADDPTAEPLLGDELRVLAEGAVVPPVAGLYTFDVRLRSLPTLTLTGIPRNDFASWLAVHFSPAEIDALQVINFLGDTDGDGCDEVCEFVGGTDPRVRDAVSSDHFGHALALSSDGLRHLFLSYVTADVDGAVRVLRSTTDLESWNDDPSQYRLHERTLLPDNRTRWTWEVLAPVGSKAREFHGHVTVLK